MKKRINNLKVGRALISVTDSTRVQFPEGTKIVTAERAMRSTTANPFFASFTGLFSFVNMYGDLIDTIITEALAVTSIKSLKKILDIDGVEKLVYSSKVGTLNYRFFNPKVNARLTPDQYLAILHSTLNLPVYSHTHEGTLYVYIEKN